MEAPTPEEAEVETGGLIVEGKGMSPDSIFNSSHIGKLKFEERDVLAG